MAPPAMMPVPAVMPTPAMMPMPSHLGGQLAGFVLYGCGNAPTDRRQRFGALRWRSQQQQARDGKKAENFFHVHVFLLGSDIRTSRAARPARIKAAANQVNAE
jgi:hypothetical protein